MDFVLELNKITKKFTDFTLNEVSFDLKPGYIMGLIGENGAGKTTIIKLITGLLRPDRGEIKVFGLDLKRHEQEIKQRIGFVYDENPFHGDLTIREMTRLIAPFYNQWNRAIYQDYVERFALPTTKKIKQLSKGMKLKYSLAIALSHEAELLILDEPTGGLDPIIRREFLEILSEVIESGSCSVLFSSHIVSDLERVADYITLIHRGQVLFCRPKEDLFKDYALISGSRTLLDEVLEPYLVGAPRKYQFGFEGMISNKDKVMGLVGEEAILTAPGLEDIMYFYTGGKRRA